MRKSILVAAFSVAAVFAAGATAQTGQVMTSSAPGVAGIAQKISVSATITAIDPKSRSVTLKGPEGKELSVVAGPEVKNFAQLKVGDKVNVDYVESLIVELKKGGGQPVAMTKQAGMDTAKPGAAPGAAAGRRITVVGDVVNVDAATQTVTLRGPQRTVDLKVRDPEQFKLISKGDQVEATYTEAAAVSVSPKP